MTYEELREEWETNSALRKIVKNVCGNTCCNCGSGEGIEYHHIVPLKLGGTNKTSNIVALCHSCHSAAHHGRHINDYANKENKGRPINEIDDDYFEAYINGIIGTRELKRYAGIPEKTHISDLTAFKKFKKKKGIEKVRNYIDVKIKNRGYVEQGEEIGFIKYTDGTVKPVTYKRLREHYDLHY